MWDVVSSKDMQHSLENVLSLGLGIAQAIYLDQKLLQFHHQIVFEATHKGSFLEKQDVYLFYFYLLIFYASPHLPFKMTLTDLSVACTLSSLKRV